MENRKSYWENIYSSNLESANTDNWLNCYKHLIKNTDKILELGCGEGYLSEYLLNNGYNIISADISETALANYKSRVPQASVMQIDMLKKLPFRDDSFNIIIADLSLHYFSRSNTENIISEIKRLLIHGGYLLARVNSDKDINFGAGKGILEEKGFYSFHGHYKRFFSREMINTFFENWNELSTAEKSTSKYVSTKHLYEIIARK